MKKSNLLIMFFVGLFLAGTVYAVDVDMKSEFKQGETFFAKVSGNFIDSITEENIVFYRKHMRTSIIPEVAKIEDDYYIYAQLLGKEKGDYSMNIEGVRYNKGFQIIEDDIIKEFSISNESADFYIEPGFVIVDGDFSIKVQNLLDKKIDIFINIDEEINITSIEEDSFSLKSGEIKNVYFEAGAKDISGLSKIIFSTNILSYEVHVFYTSKNHSDNGIEDMKGKLRFDPSEVNVSLSTNFSTSRIIYLENFGDNVIENITLSVPDSLRDYVFLLDEKIDEIEKNSSYKLELIFSSGDEEEFIEGQLRAKSGDEIAYLAVFINSIKDYIPINGESNITKTCEELGGEVCKNNEDCEGNIFRARDNVCCFGECKQKEINGGGDYNKLMGWGIIIFLVLFLVWFYLKKYKGASREVSLFNRK